MAEKGANKRRGKRENPIKYSNIGGIDENTDGIKVWLVVARGHRRRPVIRHASGHTQVVMTTLMDLDSGHPCRVVCPRRLWSCLNPVFQIQIIRSVSLDANSKPRLHANVEPYTRTD